LTTAGRWRCGRCARSARRGVGLVINRGLRIEGSGGAAWVGP
jgi:hypothetical protein